MKNHNVRTRLFSPDGPNDQAVMIFNSNIRAKLSVIQCRTEYFSVADRTGSSPTDINRFGSHTGKLTNTACEIFGNSLFHGNAP